MKWRSAGVRNTGYVNSIHDRTTGQGAAVTKISRVEVEFDFYCDEEFRERLPGLKDRISGEFRIGEARYGLGIDDALSSMKAGGVRLLQIRSEVCQPLTDRIGGYREGSKVYVLLKLLAVE